MSQLPLIISASYILASCLFILGLKRMSAVRTASQGNSFAALGMLLAIVATLANHEVVNYSIVGIFILVGAVLGILMAVLTPMTGMPQMVATLNGFGGLASALVASGEFLRQGGNLSAFTLSSISLGVIIGGTTFAGSMMAFGKLQGIVSQRAVVFPLQRVLNFFCILVMIGLTVWINFPQANPLLFWAIGGLAFVFGILLVLPIGGADMPVVIAFLNSMSGLAATMAGFALMNKMLIVAGTLVGASGMILSGIMCRAMNRSLVSVFLGGFGQTAAAPKGKADSEYTSVKSCTVEEAAMLLDNAQSVIVVPGYGLAVARAQHAVGELAEFLEAKGTSVKYAIHPVAGRMPGHMNVLLAEAEVPYDKLYEMDVINPEFDQTDVALVIGANDVTNPAAHNEPGSPIYGMPILNVDKARTIIVIKRSLSPGYAGIKNPLFENEKTVLFYDDAKKAIESVTKELKSL